MKLLVAVAAIMFLGGIVHAENGKKVVGRQVASVKSSTIKDTVVNLRADEERVIVVFEKNKGSFSLGRDNKNFASAHKKLEESLKNKKPLSVEIDALELNILEVK